MRLVALILLLAVSAVVSGSETAVFSLRPADRRRLSAASAFARSLLADPGGLLIALLLANLAVNVAFFSISAAWSLDLAERDAPVASALVGVGSVLALILVGEIAAKTVALAMPTAIVRSLAPALAVLRVVLSPLVGVSRAATDVIQSLVMGRDAVTATPGASDFKSALASRATVGAYRGIELALLHDVIDFGERRARQLMTPRVRVAFLDVDDPRGAWLETMARRPHMEYPVCQGSPDKLLGVVNAAECLAAPETPRLDLVRPALLAPVNLSAERLVRRMQQEGARIAVLLDEHGGVAGVVGLAALTRAVLGEIVPTPDPAAGGPGRIERRRDGAVIVDGDLPLHVLTDEYGVEFSTRRADSVGGALAEAVGRVPRRGDELAVEGWRLRVVDDSRRIPRVLVRRRVGAERDEPTSDGDTP